MADQDEFFDELYRTHGAIVYRYVRSIAGNLRHDVAEEIVQETFVRALRRWSEFAEETIKSPVAYLLGIARNLAVDAIKKNHRARRCLAACQCEAIEQLVSDPAHAAQVHDDVDRIRRHCDGLQPLDREAMTMWVNGKTYRQIAAVQDRPEGTIKTVVYQFRRSSGP